MFLLRHGQSYFNLHFTPTRIDPGIEDPELTELGHAQAQAAAQQLAEVPLTRIIISPYVRALQTAEPIVKSHQAPVQIMQEVRERAAFTCDVGRSPESLAAQFPQHDFGHLPLQWWSDPVETLEATTLRADNFRAMMAMRSDAQTTLLVSHWAFILALTGKSLENGELMKYDPNSGKPARIDWEA
jgi:glucosyl-3-phosphoglycerate phosphatase